MRTRNKGGNMKGKKKVRNEKLWKKAEELLLEKLYQKLPASAIAGKLKRTTVSVQKKARRMGLHK